MEWLDDALVLAARDQGESAAVTALLTRDRGRWAGLVRGVRTARQRGVLEPGARVQARWRGRLADHLGHFTLELVHGHAAALLDEPLRLAALAAACALGDALLPDHQPHPGAFNGLAALLDQLTGPVWDAAYVQWEVGMLQELGYGLDLSACAITGRHDDLAFVSPRTGRAVSAAAVAAAGAVPWRDRLLPLPRFLTGRGAADPDSVLSGLALTGAFFDRLAPASRSGRLPAARGRFVEAYRQAAARSAKQAP